MSTDKGQTNNAFRGSLRLAENSGETEHPKTPLPRQFVNFTFYRARPEWRSLEEREKESARREFLETVEEYRREMLIHTYSLVGLRANAEFMIWRIGYTLDPMQEMTSRLNRTGMSKYLETTQSFLSMTKRSMYIDKD
ncbi:MAG TPA: chlorite dismutase family protein, partial [Pyrinomonadaceae bacterium]|nr:chlorite dismutase family protein [Pyrinomonadaceae bacterium]